MPKKVLKEFRVEYLQILDEEGNYDEPLMPKLPSEEVKKIYEKLTQMDIPEAREHLAQFREAVQQPVWEISCATGQGIPELVQAIWKQVSALPLNS